MSTKTFLVQLTVVAGILAVLLIGLKQFPQLAPYTDLGWITWILFIGITVLLFFVGNSRSTAQNKNSFLHLVILTMIGKMFLAFFLSVVYYSLTKPDEKVFILPMFMIYFGFTIYETYLLMRLGKKTSEV